MIVGGTGIRGNTDKICREYIDVQHIVVKGENWEIIMHKDEFDFVFVDVHARKRQMINLDTDNNEVLVNDLVCNCVKDINDIDYVSLLFVKLSPEHTPNMFRGQ